MPTEAWGGEGWGGGRQPGLRGATVPRSWNLSDDGEVEHLTQTVPRFYRRCFVPSLTIFLRDLCVFSSFGSLCLLQMCFPVCRLAFNLLKIFLCIK